MLQLIVLVLYLGILQKNIIAILLIQYLTRDVRYN